MEAWPVWLIAAAAVVGATILFRKRKGCGCGGAPAAAPAAAPVPDTASGCGATF